MLEGIDSAAIALGLNSYPEVGLAWLSRTLQRSDATGALCALASCLISAKAQEETDLSRGEGDGFLKAASARCVETLCGARASASKGPLPLRAAPYGRLFQRAPEAARALLQIASDPSATPAFAAGALDRLIQEPELLDEFWEKNKALVTTAARVALAASPAWGAFLKESAWESGAFFLCEQLGGPARERGANMVDLAKALSGVRPQEGEAFDWAVSGFEALEALAPELLKGRGALRATPTGADMRQPLNWRCDDRTKALALRKARDKAFGCVTSQAGPQPLLALGLALINASQPLAFKEALAVFAEEGISLCSQFGSRQHLQGYSALYEARPGAARGRGDSVPIKPLTLMEGALLANAAWARDALIEAGAPLPKPAGFKKRLLEWEASFNRGASPSRVASRKELLNQIQADYEGWCLESALPASAAPAAKSARM